MHDPGHQGVEGSSSSRTHCGDASALGRVVTRATLFIVVCVFSKMAERQALLRQVDYVGAMSAFCDHGIPGAAATAAVV
jgi:hypothetical protein